jgi:hypothetical protein
MESNKEDLEKKIAELKLKDVKQEEMGAIIYLLKEFLKKVQWQTISALVIVLLFGYILMSNNLNSKLDNKLEGLTTKDDIERIEADIGRIEAEFKEFRKNHNILVNRLQKLHPKINFSDLIVEQPVAKFLASLAPDEIVNSVFVVDKSLADKLYSDLQKDKGLEELAKLYHLNIEKLTGKEIVDKLSDFTPIAVYRRQSNESAYLTDGKQNAIISTSQSEEQENK